MEDRRDAVEDSKAIVISEISFCVTKDESSPSALSFFTSRALIRRGVRHIQWRKDWGNPPELAASKAGNSVALSSAVTEYLRGGSSKRWIAVEIPKIPGYYRFSAKNRGIDQLWWKCSRKFSVMESQRDPREDLPDLMMITFFLATPFPFPFPFAAVPLTAIPLFCPFEFIVNEDSVLVSIAIVALVLLLPALEIRKLKYRDGYNERMYEMKIQGV